MEGERSSADLKTSGLEPLLWTLTAFGRRGKDPRGQFIPPLLCAWPSRAPQENPGLEPQESPGGVHVVLNPPLILHLGGSGEDSDEAIGASPWHFWWFGAF